MSEVDVTAAEFDEQRRTFTADERKAAAKKGAAMPDGSFPILNQSDLANAIQAIGRAKDPAAAKAHIKKRAAALGLSSLIPEDWRGDDYVDSMPSREGLRANYETTAVELRDATEERDGRLATLFGHFAVFNRWTKIDSAREGRFMEQIAPGAFTKTFNEQRNQMRVLFNHGKDPQIGDKPLGPIETLREDDVGAYYEVPLLDTSYNRDLLPLIEAGQYGASFRFRVMRDDLVRRPPATEWNPDGIPQRTVQETSTKEFGPVTFGAYSDASAGIRSITDEIDMLSFTRDPERLLRLVEFLEAATSDRKTYTEEEYAPPETRRPDTPPISGRRGHTTEGTTRWWPDRTQRKDVPASWRASTN